MATTPRPITDTAERCDLVARELRTLGYPEAYGGHSGGGIFCVYIPETRFGPNEEWIFGMAGDQWAGNRLDGEGFCVDGTEIVTGVDADASDVASLRKVATDIDQMLRNL
jgi:hypothetical protein